MARTEEKRQGKGNGRGRGRSPIVELPVAESEPARGAPTYETGRHAFLRIAERRMNDLLAKLATLGKLSSSKTKYGYTDEDVEQIRVTLINAVNATCDRLRRVPSKPGFKFSRGSTNDEAVR